MTRNQKDFDPVHWRYLTRTLRLKPAIEADARSLTLAEFMDPERCRTVLDHLGPIIGAPRRRITASLLSKRLAFLLTGACLYALSACDRGLDVSADNCVIELGHDGDRWASSLPLCALDARTWTPSARDSEREEIVAALFAGLIAPLWRVFHQVSGVPMRMLWENTAVRVYSLYERRMASLTSPAAIARRDRDFRFLIQSSPSLFGESFNPLARFFLPMTPVNSVNRIRFRRTCCLYFQATRPPEYCLNCPLLKVDPALRRHSASATRLQLDKDV